MILAAARKSDQVILDPSDLQSYLEISGYPPEGTRIGIMGRNTGSV